MNETKPLYIIGDLLTELVDGLTLSTGLITNVHFDKLVKSIDYEECSKDDEHIINHIKKCNNCKNKLLRFLIKIYLKFVFCLITRFI